MANYLYIFLTFIANKIKGVLTSIIHTDQKRFVKGRFIGENIRLTSSMNVKYKIEMA